MLLESSSDVAFVVLVQIRNGSRLSEVLQFETREWDIKLLSLSLGRRWWSVGFFELRCGLDVRRLGASR